MSYLVEALRTYLTIAWFMFGSLIVACCRNPRTHESSAASLLSEASTGRCIMGGEYQQDGGGEQGFFRGSAVLVALLGSYTTDPVGGACCSACDSDTNDLANPERPGVFSIDRDSVLARTKYVSDEAGNIVYVKKTSKLGFQKQLFDAATHDLLWERTTQPLAVGRRLYHSPVYNHHSDTAPMAPGAANGHLMGDERHETSGDVILKTHLRKGFHSADFEFVWEADSYRWKNPKVLGADLQCYQGSSGAPVAEFKGNIMSRHVGTLTVVPAAMTPLALRTLLIFTLIDLIELQLNSINSD
ncbi:hypothetical protein IWQ60_011095 [Tieghemiomyces parasiticus]|uniref:Uncharacterized protein n=1 Tax=Tieghemiomyces parasiticus TaxID=78921 RepID=A0A9W8DHM7_9FUNG|nr:hypothetical protein IWQ60_011095 [Tieghemiomyces parasiticus]